MTKSEILKRAQDMKLHGVMSDGQIYTCNECGAQWKPRDRYVWWPIRVGWHGTPRVSTRFFDWHGWQTGWDGIEQRVFGQTFHVGRLFIALGRQDPVMGLP